VRCTKENCTCRDCGHPDPVLREKKIAPGATIDAQSLRTMERIAVNAELPITIPSELPIRTNPEHCVEPSRDIVRRLER
jgi:hypothetical protein